VADREQMGRRPVQNDRHNVNGQKEDSSRQGDPSGLRAVESKCPPITVRIVTGDALEVSCPAPSPTRRRHFR
jgi:hypothetical protein